jgi:hypothetical protein
MRLFLISVDNTFDVNIDANHFHAQKNLIIVVYFYFEI